MIPDQAGDFVATGTGKSMHLRDALYSEAVVCLAPIGGAIRIGANRIIFKLVLPVLWRLLECSCISH